jgi:uncharacterized membrane protein YgaE (UPF0421/DUF939 family)
LPKEQLFLIPVSSAPLANILSYTFSISLGTTVITVGFTSFILSLIFSMDSQNKSKHHNTDVNTKSFFQNMTNRKET